MASASALFPNSLSFYSRTLSVAASPRRDVVILQFRLRGASPRLTQASRRASNLPQEDDNLVFDPRNWNHRSRSGVVVGDYGENDDEDNDGEDEEDQSLDLLVRFVQNALKKISRKSRKAVRSVLPPTISTKLVDFSVNGVINLAFLWVLKAFLEVVCTIGSAVFVSILLIRGILTGISYLQESRNRELKEFDLEQNAWTGTRPAM